jgi:DNA-binding NtrC family response regulator
MERSKLLVVDDEANMRATLRANLERKDYSIMEAEDGVEALEVLSKNDIPLVVTDLKMPRMDGITLLKTMYEKYPHIKSIMITAHGTVQDAVMATKLGAYDYITKPFDFNELESAVKRALASEESDQEPRFATNSEKNIKPFIGETSVMKEVMDVIQRVADSDSSVLVTGETGTGKELVAKAIHHSSSRSSRPFVAVNCSAIPATLLESELFGHEKGAFTGASSMHIGRFELANKGTLFLDEIGEMAPELQAKLLRVLQERSFERVGGSATIHSDFRLVTATNRDLESEVENGNFREDLFYRIGVIPISLPPLRKRGGDIVLLLDYFMELFSKKLGAEKKEFTDDALDTIKSYNWPGNIRELENMVERCMVLTKGQKIDIGNLPPKIRRSRDQIGDGFGIIQTKTKEP